VKTLLIMAGMLGMGIFGFVAGYWRGRLAEALRYQKRYDELKEEVQKSQVKLQDLKAKIEGHQPWN
jgi:hypothetical protein